MLFETQKLSVLEIKLINLEGFLLIKLEEVKRELGYSRMKTLIMIFLIQIK